MGKGNVQKAAQKRERNAAKYTEKAGSQLKSNEAANTVKCKVCMYTSALKVLQDHQENKHPKSSMAACFPEKVAATD